MNFRLSLAEVFWVLERLITFLLSSEARVLEGLFATSSEKQIPVKLLTDCIPVPRLGTLGGLWAGDQNYGHHMISFYTYQEGWAELFQKVEFKAYSSHAKCCVSSGLSDIRFLVIFFKSRLFSKRCNSHHSNIIHSMGGLLSTERIWSPTATWTRRSPRDRALWTLERWEGEVGGQSLGGGGC